MERIVAYCGLVCSECEAYLATQANDIEALERMAATAREQYGVASATAENGRCDGCPGETVYKGACTSACNVRRCAVERGVATCAACAEYGCDLLTVFWANAPSARATLEALRAPRGDAGPAGRIEA